MGRMSIRMIGQIAILDPLRRPFSGCTLIILAQDVAFEAWKTHWSLFKERRSCYHSLKYTGVDNEKYFICFGSYTNRLF